MRVVVVVLFGVILFPFAGLAETCVEVVKAAHGAIPENCKKGWFSKPFMCDNDERAKAICYDLEKAGLLVK